MDEPTRAVYKVAIKRYEEFLSGKPVNVIDPNGKIPSKKTIRTRLRGLQEAIK